LEQGEKVNSRDKNKARLKFLAYEKRNNIIRPETCPICNKKSPYLKYPEYDIKQIMQAHHDDYLKPFDIKWMCFKCHAEFHKNNKLKICA
jgi:hypothetical protein